MLINVASEKDFDDFFSSKNINNFASDLILVEFFAPWCPPCKALKVNLEKLSNEEKNLEILFVNVENLPELANRPEFKIESIPSLFLFLNEKKIREKKGYLSME